MKFGNASWGFRELPISEQLRITRDMGLKYLELDIANAPNDLALDAGFEELDHVKALYREYGVELTHAATGNDFTNGNRDDVPKVKRVIDMCAYLGAEYLRIFAGFSPVEEVVGVRWDTMIDCLREVGSYAMEKSVTLTIETHGGVNGYEDGVEHFYSTSSKPEALYQMLSALPEHIKVNYDPANLYAVGVEHPETVYERIKNRVAVVHLKDFSKLPSGHIMPVACGEGGQDWNAIMKALQDFKGVCLFEYENPEDIEAGSMRCLNYIQNN